jgi:predicted Zn-dependent protease with MMP-like domain
MHSDEKGLTDKEFREVVSEAIDRLPEDFKTHLDNVEIIVEDAPDREQLGRMRGKYHGGRRFTLLGLYEGVPVGKQSVFSIPGLPARITLFRKTIEAYCSTREDMVDQIYRTLLHEIGHHFGMSDKRLRELGF